MMAPGGGRIELICGPMFAGKTTELLRRLAAARSSGSQVVALQPIGDTRNGSGWLKSHDGMTFPAVPLAGADELLPAVGASAVAGIDEAHFFAADMADACRSLAQRGVRVIAAGVDLDQRGKLFPAVAALQACADECTVLTSTCTQCGAVARFTQRLVASDAPIVVGGAEAYEPRCNRCFEPRAGG